MPESQNDRSRKVAQRYHRLLQARDAAPGRLEGAGGGLESVAPEAPAEADLSEVAIRARLAETKAQLAAFVRAELGDDARLHSLVDEILHQGGSALRALRDDEQQLAQNPQMLGGLEAIARTDGSRPSFLIRDGRVDQASSPIGGWAETLVVSQDLLNSAIACVGRVNLGGQHVGTGYLIGADLILTNRHVLQGIANVDSNGKWTFRPQGASIDFGHEHGGRASVNRRGLSRVLFAGKDRIDPMALDHRKLDLALIELGPGQATEAPLAVLSVGASRAWAQPETVIFTIGYPGRPAGNFYQPTLLEQLFQSTYGCKRLAPGELMTPQSPLHDWTLAHDATTLGGNSGSAVLVLGNEMVAAGLHYGGQPQVGTVVGENWGHVLGLVLEQTDGYTDETLGDVLRGRGVEIIR